MIVLITPTGGRSKQFELCCTWMRKQTYTGKVLWIVVDDCIPYTTENTKDFPDNWTIVKKYPFPSWKQGENTQSRNLKAGIDIVKKFPKDQIEGIFIIEDDDYYSAEYLEKMVVKLKGFDITGESFTTYYHIRAKKYDISKNALHASLFQTAFSFDMIPEFEKCYGEKFIDIKFFKNSKNVNLFSQENLAIGIKGLSGRTGIGSGHREQMYRNPDKNMEKLKELIGKDYLYYV